MSELFYLDDYFNKKETIKDVNINKEIFIKNKSESFKTLCQNIENAFDSEWENEQGKGENASDLLLEYQKNAIIGYDKEVNYFKSKIKDYLKKEGLENSPYPEWYSDLITGIFEEIWGVAGIYKWKTIANSSSAKIIGERIYYMIDGKQRLQPQKISQERLNRLINALLLRNPEIRLAEKDNAEVYMIDGTRIAIYDTGMVKEPVIVFRKYIVENYSFEEQAKRNTIDEDFVQGLKALAQIGYNVNFIGPVRTAKTTMLQTWQMYEDSSLEGVMIETDPEIPLHIRMPNAPIMQIVADGEKLESVIKQLMRSDADYFIMAEARDPVALYIQMMVTAKGTRRTKGTFHTSDPIDFCYDAGAEIVRKFGGDLFTTAIKVAKGYHYLIEMTQLKDKSKKRLKAIYEIRYNPIELQVTIHQIVKYNYIKDDWEYRYDIGQDKENIAIEENYEAFKIFKSELKRLATEKPIHGNTVFKPFFSKLIEGGRK